MWRFDKPVSCVSSVTSISLCCIFVLFVFLLSLVCLVLPVSLFVVFLYRFVKPPHWTYQINSYILLPCDLSNLHIGPIRSTVTSYSFIFFGHMFLRGKVGNYNNRLYHRLKRLCNLKIPMG
jgi:hypothetical protein